MARAKKELKDNSAAYSTPSPSNRNPSSSSHRRQLSSSQNSGNSGVRNVSAAYRHTVSSPWSHPSPISPERDAEVSCCKSMSGTSKASSLSDLTSHCQKVEWQPLGKPSSPHYLSTNSPSSSQSSSFLPVQDSPSESDAGAFSPTSTFSYSHFDHCHLDMRSSFETNSDVGDLIDGGLHDAMRGLRVGESYTKEATEQELSCASENGTRESSLETRSRLEEEEAALEETVIEVIHSRQWDLLRPNTGQSVSLGDHHICVGYQEDPSSPGYRAWEWHGHIMIYEEGEGYTPEYVYGNYFEPLEDEDEEYGLAMGLGRGLGGIITGVERRGTCTARLVGLS